MNYLLHLYLADPTPESLLGNLMGDFVKGRLDESISPELRQGITLHRRVDSFAHDHDLVRRSKNRISPRYGHYRSIMVDIFYDHFLARNWQRYAPMPLESFAAGVYRLLQEREAQLPTGLRRIAPRMIAHNWLVSYRDVQVIGRVLAGVSGRLRRANPLAEGLGELTRNYDVLQEDFETFVTDLEAFVAEIKAGGVP
ncbi:ACP phosphodiesterase [Desulfuromonas versatilis]|uniref:ACP phosphodiesterase n=1 Tax=Desulfuromonas versatilis TaxID=2802975 RepID=A0ABM8HZB8_9BACT|nr:ACP phosphodiesterase [Desulfuromonas versatilis]BCR05859.1 ACP phosphodiesterase [Desulfuromonas versatilis]